MSKVYLLYSYKGNEMWPVVEGVCATLDAAEKEKQKKELYIQNVKTQYYLEFDADYDKEAEWIDENITHEKFEEVVGRYYLYQAKYSDLDIRQMEIVEKELIADYLTQLKSKIPHERYNKNKLILAFRNLDWGRVQPLQIRIPKDLYNDLNDIEKEYLKVVMAQYPIVDYKWE